MANKSLTDLTARTATADSDLIHVNSGGTDYKETKANFLSNITSSISSINSSLTNSLVVGDPYVASVSLSTAGIQFVDVQDITTTPSKSGYNFVGWQFQSTSYRYTAIGMGGVNRLYYYVGTTYSSGGSIFCYPVFKKN